MFLTSRAQRAERGSILLLCLMVTGTFAMLALSFSSSARTQMAAAFDESQATRADLVAQSGVEYARLRLLDDAEWIGTEESVAIPGGGRFELTVTTDQAEQVATVLSTGVLGLSQARHEAIVSIQPGDPLRSLAFAVVGGDVRAEQVEVDGDLLIVDRDGRVWDYLPDGDDDGEDDDDCESGSAPAGGGDDGPGGGHRGPLLVRDLSRTLLASPRTVSLDRLRRKVGDRDTTRYFADAVEGRAAGAWARTVRGRRPTVRLRGLSVNGACRSLAGRVLGEGGDCENQTVDWDIHAPGWNLDRYLLPNDKITLLEGVRRLKDVHSEKTVVLKVRRGQRITLQNVNLRGGLVIWAEEDWAQAHGDRARNRVVMRGDCNLGGGASGVDENIGLLAPCAEISAPSSGLRTWYGMSYLGSIEDLRHLRSTGSLLVRGDVQDLEDAHLIEEEEAGIDPPGGILFFGGVPEVDVTSVIENL